jgi:hypothetical protein
VEITGRVAKIADESRLVLNVGSAHGVKPGMHFVVFQEGEDVTDPETGESLGMMELVKAEVIVEHVQDRMCIASAPQIQEDDPDSTVLSARLARVRQAAHGSVRREKLYVNSGQISGSQRVSPISVGDRVRSVASPG